MKPKDFKNRNNQPRQKVQTEVATKAPETVEEVTVQEPQNVPNAEVVDIDNFLNIRSMPKVEKGNIIAMLTNGTKIIVVDKKPVEDREKNEWYKIKVLDPELDGYAMKKYIKVI